MKMSSAIIRQEAGPKADAAPESNRPADPITASRLSAVRFDEVFLERSWHWLHDPEIKRLTLSPDFTREEQLLWFAWFPGRTDYLIWGLAGNGIPIGAMGLKNITRSEAEYWGYIGDRSYWNRGLGREMMGFIFDQSKKLGLKELYLKVHRDNPRAIRLYTRVGFKTVREDQDVFHMRLSLKSAKSDVSATVSVTRYTPDRQQEWDRFLNAAKNATFLFRRDYMDYHRDRFTDHSLMVYCGGRLAALLPANESAEDTIISHEGLTYGGLVVPRSATLREVLSDFRECLHYLHERRIATLRYKRIPGFYNTLPDDEVAYALFLLEARLYRRDCTAVVSQADRLPFEARRQRQIKKAGRTQVRIVQETDYTAFWERVLAPCLAARHGVKPVHTAEEIKLLASRFPESIKQYSIYCEEEIVAGTTIFETPTVAHAQYIAATDRGQKIGALDYLFGWLLDGLYRDKRYFDFGICNEQAGRVLNQGLLDWKEGFGGRCYVHDFYEIATANYSKLEPAGPSTPAKC
jgi:RimJ/RimL family protein N-acetyltransferase